MKKQRTQRHTATAVDMARTLSPEQLQSLVAEKTPPVESAPDPVAGLLEAANKLPPEQLAVFVKGKETELRALQILHLQRSVTGATFGKPELEGLLVVLGGLPAAQRADLAGRAQQAALAAGLTRDQLENYARKLTCIGLHL